MSKNDELDPKGLARRNALKAGIAAGVGAALLPAPAAAAQGAESGGSKDELTFVNGRIHTMDDDNSVVSSVAIRDGRFVAVGNAANPGPGSNVINLHGRTVVPGLIESHTHFVSLANRPGYHVAQWELASNVAGVLAALAARRAAQPEVPPGQFITAMGAGTPRMFAELRLPFLAELDAAVPDRPVFLYQGGGGPARTNTLGKQFFESATAPLAGPCVVGADGTIAGGNPNMANRALYHLRIRQTFDDKKRSALDAMAFSASVGITAVPGQTLAAVATGPRPSPRPRTRTATRCGTSRSAWSPRRAGATRTRRPAARPARPRSSRSSRPTRRWTVNSASRSCAGACSTRPSPRRISSRA